MFKTFIGAAAIVSAAAAVAPANAAVFDFTNLTVTGTTYGNSYGPKTVSGVTLVSATAWSTNSAVNSNLPVAAYLGGYDKGFGVINQNDGGTAYHTIDNVGSFDFVRLEFSTAVSISGLIRNGFDVGSGSIDSDAWISYGATTDNFTTGWAGYLTRGVAVSNSTNFMSTNFARVWLIGADRSGLDATLDGFKLGGMTAVAAAGVPEPATWGMMLLGFGAVGGAMRRRKVATRVTYA